MRLLAFMSVLMYIVVAEIANGVANGGWDTNDSGNGHFSLNFGVDIDSTTKLESPSIGLTSTATSTQRSLISVVEHHTWDSTSTARPIGTSLPQAFGSSLTTSAAYPTTTSNAIWGTGYASGMICGTSAGTISAASTGGFLSGGGNTSSWTLPKGPMTLAPKASLSSHHVSTQSRRLTSPPKASMQSQSPLGSNSSAVAQSEAPLGAHKHVAWFYSLVSLLLLTLA